MIHSVEINRLRGIRHGRIDGLSQVNLFFGKNNCGKSTLLEGLFLVCGQSNPLLPASINRMRAYDRLTESDIPYFFYQMKTDEGIEISTSGDQKRNLLISSFKEITPNDTNEASTLLSSNYGFRMQFSTEDGEFSSEIKYDTGQPNEIKPLPRVDNRYIEQLRCMYLSPRYDSNASMQGLHNVYMKKDEDFLAEALQIIEPKAKNPMFMDNVMFVDADLPQRIPINLMGDGIRKIVSFLTCIYECRDGVVLIDELSNGFHYSVMKPVWDIVIRAAIKNNVQIFATTHDLDSIKGFQDAALDLKDERGKEIVKAFKLQRIKDDELKAYSFTAKQLKYAIEQEMEVR